MSVLLTMVRLLHEVSEFLNDTRYSIKTAGHLMQDETGVLHPDANEYAATPYRVVRRLFRHVPKRCLEGTFIDYGSGRGRVAIMAARQGFRRVIGIEISAMLHSEAQQNVRSSEVRRKCAIELVNTDASQFDIPSDATVLFFYKPFGKATTCEVVRRIEESLSVSPREIWLLGYNSALLEDVASKYLCAKLMSRSTTVYPTIPWAVLRVLQRPPLTH